MSDRQVDFTAGAFVRFVREVRDHIAWVRSGGLFRGRVSFDDTIRIGPVEITCEFGTGNIGGVLRIDLPADQERVPLALGDTDRFPQPPFVCTVESEKIYVRGFDGDDLFPVGRGFDNTAAVAHPTGRGVLLIGDDVVQVILTNTETGQRRVLAVLT